MPPSNTSANKIAQRAARPAPLRFSGATIRKTAKQVAKSIAQSVANGFEMNILQLTGIENWPLDVERSKSNRVVFPATIHKLEKEIYKKLLKTKKLTESEVEKRKREVTGEQEKLIVLFKTPLYMQHPSDRAVKIYAEKVEILNYHPARHVKVTWKPRCTTDPEEKEENKAAIDMQKKNIATDEFVRLEIYHNRMLETIEKMKREMHQLNIANQDLRYDNQRLRTKVEELQQGEYDNSEVIGNYREMTATFNEKLERANTEIKNLKESLRRERGYENADQEVAGIAIDAEFPDDFAPEERQEYDPEQVDVGEEEDTEVVETIMQAQLPVLREQKPLGLLDGLRAVVKEEHVARVVIKTEVNDVE